VRGQTQTSQRNLGRADIRALTLVQGQVEDEAMNSAPRNHGLEIAGQPETHRSFTGANLHSTGGDAA